MSESGDPIRVIHVDDEPGFADVAAEFLERENEALVVETATSAEAGIEHIADNAVDCIVSDYDMPGDNGIEFLERVRGIDAELPFILFTGKGSEEIASDAISAGVTDYLQKESATSQYTVLANRIRNAVEKHRAKREVEASQKRLSLFIEQSPLGVLEYDEGFEIVRINERAEEILGYSEAELRGHTWKKLVSEDSYDDVDSVTDDLAEGTGGYHSVDENVRKDGERIVCEWHNRIVTDDDGDVVAVFSLFQDITERRERERRLRRSSARLEALFENSPDGIAIHDTEGTIREVNPQLCEMTGYDETELVGMNVWEVDETVEPEAARRVWEGMAVGDRRTFEGRYRRQDGSAFPVEVHVRRLSLDGDDRFVASSRGIEARKRRQEERETLRRSRRKFHRITTATGLGHDGKIERLLEVGRELLGVENAHLTAVDHETGRHEVRFAVGSDLVETGPESELAEAVRSRTIEADDLGLEAEIAEGDPTERFEIGRHVGSALVVDGELFGTVCFVDHEREGEPLSGTEEALVELVGRCVSHVLENEIRRRERSAIIDRMTDVLFAVDREWRIEYANEHGWAFIDEEHRGADDTGDGGTDIRSGIRLWEALSEAVGTEFHETCLQAMDEGQPRSSRAYYPPRDRWLEVRAYPSETGLSVYVRDITDEHRREETIQRRERVLREIYDAISDVDRTFERKVEALIDIGRRVIDTEYGSLARIDGEEYTFEVIEGPDGAVEPGEIIELGETNCERTVSTERTVVLADIAEDAPELTRREGYTEWGISCYVGTPIFVDGSLYGTFCLYGTERREEPFSEWEVSVVDLMGKWISYELRRRRTERRLRTQNERLEEFSSVVSHDLRNPLSVADGNLELARTECDSDYLDAVGDALDRMETLIENLLELATEGETVTDPETIDLGEAAERYWRNVETADATLVVDIDRAVEADPSRLAQLFENLFRNSIEHGDAGVTVTVGELADGFYVADDGAGIDPDDRERIFEAGYSDAQSGTGFGLAIVDRIVEAHGWRVRAATGDDGGARFEVTGVGGGR